MVSDDATVSRRAVLRASSGVFGGAGIVSGRASGDDHSKTPRCPEATLRPSMIHYDAPEKVPCEEDHPRTEELREEVRESFETNYPTVGALIDAGYVPYFDFMTASDDSGVSHWINPDFLGDETLLDADRPESVLVDHEWWRPIGAMFIAVREGEPVDPPPTVYSDDGGHECLPWHSHVGMPGRYAWWKYQHLYVDGGGDVSRGLPCRTPWMMHVWAYPHPASTYAHGPPPRENRGGPPAEPAGFETDADPRKDDLDLTVLPDAIRHRKSHRS